jgi:hypothetical protein
VGSVVKAGCVRALLAFACLSGSIAALAEEPAVVSNEDHEVSVVRVELRGALHNGMVQPPSEDEAFLLVFIETADPCFDFERNLGCFPEAGYMEDLDKVAWACGEIALGEDDVRSADGGGQLADGLACSYVVPISATTIRLILRGYPEINLEPAQ